MKTTTKILFALLTLICTACSTWTPKERVVTLEDVDRDLAATEGSDLRYQVAEPPDCEGRAKGCRDVTSADLFEPYRWEALCDGRFCGSDELRHVDLVREAARIAFTSEQIVAALKLAKNPETSETDRQRLLAFARRASADMTTRIVATSAALSELPTGTFEEKALQREADAAVERALQYLEKARSAMADAERLERSGTAYAVRGRSVL